MGKDIHRDAKDECHGIQEDVDIDDSDRQSSHDDVSGLRGRGVKGSESSIPSQLQVCQDVEDEHHDERDGSDEH